MRPLFIAAMISILITGCKKETEEKILIQGFVVTDAYGNVITNIGSVDDDWTTGDFSSLSAKEQSIVNYRDSSSLMNTTKTDVFVLPAYPNPGAQQTRIQFRSNDSVQVKMVLIDERGKIYNQFDSIIKGVISLSIDISDRLKFPSGKSLRLIYTFSAQGYPNFKAGRGDIKVCDHNNVSACF